MVSKSDILNEIGSLESYMEHTLVQSVYPEAGSGSNVEIAYLGLGLAGEAGEAVDVIKKIVRMGEPVTLEDKHNLEEYRAKLLGELGDTIWYMAQIMRVFGFTLEEVINFNVIKLNARINKGEVKHHS